MTDPFDQMAKLGRLLSEKAAELGLTQAQFAPIVDLEGGRHAFQAMYVLEGPLGEPEEPEIEPLPETEDDPILAGILAATDAAEEARKEQERQELHELAQAALEQEMAERAQRAREMKERLRDPKRGFLDD